MARQTHVGRVQRGIQHRNVLTGYRNTIFYTLAGTAINVVITVLCAYPLSRRDMPMRGFFMFLFVFTMFFSGGLIPTYLLVNSLGMVNTVWSLLIPGAMSVYNMIITRTFFQNTVPKELLKPRRSTAVRTRAISSISYCRCRKR